MQSSIEIPKEPNYQAALLIARTLREAGHQAYFAGGCVRDLLLGQSPQDYDVATSATPPEITALFRKTRAVGAHFGVILVVQSINGFETTTEVATFRHDGAYSDGRRPDAVRFSTSPEEDVLRRDFTINGMLLDPLAIDPLAFETTGDANTAVLDYVQGREDLAAGIIRAIGDPTLRFTEDKLRMLRAIRFAARLDFQIDPATSAAITAQAATIHHVSAERVRDELTRILTEGGARRGFELLDTTGLLAQIIPDALKMKGVAQPPEYHPEGDVWTHTMLLLEKLSTTTKAGVPHPFAASPRMGGMHESPQPQVSSSLPSREASRTVRSTPTLAWGALLHDIGKPATYQPPNPAIPNDRIRFNGHVEAGVRIAEVILARLRFSNEDATQILALIKNHMRFGDILHMKQSTLKRFLRLPRFDEHLALHYLDVSSAHGDLRLYDFARAQFHAEPAEEHRPAPLLTGADLIAAGYRPSPQFKPMLELAEDAQLESTITTREQALALVREHYPAKAEK
jgi:poly(A) polymerase